MFEAEQLFSLCCVFPLKVIFQSFKIFLRNKRVFISIFALASFPLSLLIFNLILSTHPTRFHIYHLEAVALYAPTRFEARHLWQESRSDALSLLRLKALFFLPCFLLSLFSAITAVNSTATAFNGKRPTFQTALAAVKQSWKRPLVTAVFVYFILLAFASVTPVLLLALTPNPQQGTLIRVIGSGIEVYLMAVLSLGMVVSIAEEKSGWEAIRLGSGLMAGRRFCGWVLSGMLILTTSSIAGKLNEEMGMPESSLKLTAATKRMDFGMIDEMGLVILYGLAVILGYVIMTVYYCECRRWQSTVGQDEQEQDRSNSV